MKINFLKNDIFNLEKNKVSLSQKSLDKLIREEGIREAVTNEDLWEFNRELRNVDHTFIYPQEILLYKNLLIKKVNKSRNKDTVVNVDTNRLSKNITKLLYTIDLSKINKIIITVCNKKYTIDFNNKDVSLNIKDGNLDNVILFYDELKRLGYNVKKINIDYNVINENNIKFTESYNFYDYDYTKLDEISKNTEINIIYAFLDSRSVNYKDYRVMVDKINEDRKFIKNEELSPLEKLLIAYDRVKRFEYNDGNRDEAIKLDRIALTNYINCVGYSDMMVEVLKGMDDNIKINTISVDCYDKNKNFIDGHERNIVIIDDDKYNVHGFYILDTTWDSYNIKKHPNYNVYDLYRHFLIPLSSYEKVFPNDSKPEIFSGKFHSLNKDNWENLKHISTMISEDETSRVVEQYKFAGMFNDKNAKEIFDYLKVDKIPDETLLKVIMKARLVEGYKEEDLPYELERLIEINNLNVDLNEVMNSTIKR